MGYMVDDSIVSAVKLWIEHGIPPGSCTELLLRGDYDRAFKSAHPLIKPHWNDHILFIENCVPEYCRGVNYDKWKGMEHYKINKKCFEMLGEKLDEVGDIFSV